MAMPRIQMPQLGKKHVIGTLTAGVIALAAGTASQQGFIPHWEGFTNPKQHGAVSVAIHQSFDPRGVITVCNGHTNYDDPNLKAGDVYTRVMCAQVIAADLPKYNAMIAKCLPADFMVGDHQHVSMISFALNAGGGNFCNSSVGREFRAGHREAACRNMGKFTRAAGVVLPGLEHRRYDKFWGEIEWCLRDD